MQSLRRVGGGRQVMGTLPVPQCRNLSETLLYPLQVPPRRKVPVLCCEKKRNTEKRPAGALNTSGAKETDKPLSITSI